MAEYNVSGTNTVGLSSSGVYDQWHRYFDNFNRADEPLGDSADWQSSTLLNIVSNEVKRTRTATFSAEYGWYLKEVPNITASVYANLWGNRNIYPTPYLFFRDNIATPTKQYQVSTYYTGGTLRVRLYRYTSPGPSVLLGEQVINSAWVNGKANGKWKLELTPESTGTRVKVYAGPSLDLQISYLDTNADRLQGTSYAGFALASEGTGSDRDMWADDFTVTYEKNLDPVGDNKVEFSNQGKGTPGEIYNVSGTNTVGYKQKGSGRRYFRFKDDFNRANGPLGSDWHTFWSGAGTDANPAHINTNQVRSNVGTVSTYRGACIANPIAAPVELAQAYVWSPVVDTYTYHYMFTRMRAKLASWGDAPTCYRMEYTRVSSTRIQLRRYVNGVSTFLTEASYTATITLKANCLWRVETTNEPTGVRIKVYAGESKTLYINYLDTHVDQIRDGQYAGFGWHEPNFSARPCYADDFLAEAEYTEGGLNVVGFSNDGSATVSKTYSESGTNAFGLSNAGLVLRVVPGVGNNSVGFWGNGLSKAMFSRSGKNRLGMLNAGAGTLSLAATGVNVVGWSSFGSGTTGSVYDMLGSNSAGFSSTGVGRLNAPVVGSNIAGFSSLGYGLLSVLVDGQNSLGFKTVGVGLVTLFGSNSVGFHNVGQATVQHYTTGTNAVGLLNFGEAARATAVFGLNSSGFTNYGVTVLVRGVVFGPVYIPQPLYRVVNFRHVGDTEQMIGHQ